MGIDSKYGRVTTEFGTIGEDEPVIVFRAQDRLVPDLLKVYNIMCKLAGSPDHHMELVHGADEPAFLAWQAGHHTQTPTSDSQIDRIRSAP